MRKMQYTKLLFSMICRKIYIPILMATIAITTLIIYSTTIKQQNDILEHSNHIESLKTGLTSNPMNLAIIFIFYVLLLSLVAWTIFRENLDNGSEIIFISRGSSRMSIIMQKYLFMFAVIFSFSLFMLPIFSGLAGMDDLLSQSEKAEWIFSMFLGMVIVGIAIASFASILLAFMNALSSILLTSLVFISMPLITISLTETHPTLEPDSKVKFTSNHQWLEGTDELTKFYPQIHDDTDLTYGNDYYNAGGYNGKISMVNLGLMKPIHNKYDSYYKYDSWRAMSSFFDIFGNNKNTNDISGTWTDEVPLKEAIEIDPQTTIDIKGKSYVRLMSPWEKTKLVMHYINRGGFVPGNKNLLETDLLKMGYYTIYMMFPGSNSDEIRRNVIRFKEFLKTNDQAAKKYKTLSFIGQKCVFERYTSYYAVDTMSPQQAFNEIMMGTATKAGFYNNEQEVTKRAWESFSHDNEMNNKDFYSNNAAYVYANSLLKEDRNRFEPDSMYPAVDIRINNNQEALDEMKHGNYLGFYDLEGTWTIPHYNTYREKSLGITIFWMLLMLSSPFISIAIYFRKDVK